MDFYVYAYLRKDTLIPYYIGKGKGRRIDKPHKGLSIPKNKKFRIVMESGLTAIGALALERRYIRWYGRKNIDEGGVLLNKTEGGDGCAMPHSEETKRKLSERFKGIKRPRTKEHQAKLSCNAKEYRITFPDGNSKIIKNINKFAKEYGLSATALRAVAYNTQNRKQYRGFKVQLL